MKTFSDLIDAHSGPGVETLKDFNKKQALDAGVEPAVVDNWKRVYDAYYGDGLSSTKQAKAAGKAAQLGLSLGMLAKIERAIAHIKHATRRHTMRLKLLDATARIPRSFAALGALIKKIVPPKNPPVREERCTISEGDDDMATLTLTTKKRFLADLKALLMRGLDPDTPVGAWMAQRLIALLRGDGSGGGVPEAAPRPLLLIALSDYIAIHNGDGDEVTLQLTDGTTMTGADYLNTVAANTPGLEAALFHPQEGPVNLYRTQRLANDKQRTLAKATQPVCAHPQCHQAADFCQIHHAHPWADGGETNLDNLVPACRYHNRINDDDRTRAKRGHATLTNGRASWVYPSGHTASNPRTHGAMEILFGS